MEYIKRKNKLKNKYGIIVVITLLLFKTINVVIVITI